MVSDFLLSFARSNLLSLLEREINEVIYKKRLSVTEAVELFEYKKFNKGYWNRSKLNEQMVNKALFIAKILYPGYSYLFLFDKATSHSVYAKNVLHTTQKNN